MAVQSSRLYANVTLPGAAGTTKMLRAAYGQDDTDDLNATTRLETFIDVEATGVGNVHA